jgi:DNA (cytosine-5)-methyltransferase 1
MGGASNRKIATRSMSARSTFKFVDLFAGLGGFHQAAEYLGGECVFASEIDAELQAVYQKNFNIKARGDIREVKPEEVPQHDLLCAGFPCQPFSKAGGQMGWDDAVRGTVFWNIIEILRLRRPKLVILENVAHFVRHDEGNTYQKVKLALESLGYTVDYHQFSPHQFGVPQIRERIYMVGSIGSLDGFEWPKPETETKDVSIHTVLDTKPADAGKLSPQVIKCLEVWQEFLELFPAKTKLPSFPIWSMEFKATYPYDRDALSRVPLPEIQKTRGCFGKSLKGLSREDIYKLVPSHARNGRGAFPRWKKLFLKQNREFYLEHKKRIDPWLPKIQDFPPSLQKLEWNCQGESRNIWEYVLQFRASGVRVKRTNTSPSLVAMTTTQVPIIAWEQRYMTARECARLQSMGDLKHLPNGISAFYALGNAVNVTVVQRILAKLLPLLDAEDDDQPEPTGTNRISKIGKIKLPNSRIILPVLA